MFKPETSEPEAVPALVARVKLATPTTPRVDGGAPQPNVITQADVNRVNEDHSVEYAIMNAADGWGPTPSERNRAPQAPSFANLNEGLTFSAISTSGFAGSAYMKSRRVG
jgi:hypothetical protein